MIGYKISNGYIFLEAESAQKFLLRLPVSIYTTYADEVTTPDGKIRPKVVIVKNQDTAVSIPAVEFPFDEISGELMG
jgi:hypothetical protein